MPVPELQVVYYEYIMDFVGLQGAKYAQIDYRERRGSSDRIAGLSCVIGLYLLAIL